ncbi:hypothetical protein NE454_02175 [Blautia producta]|nr:MULTISPECIES: hypothetical protein [Blautia]MCQ4742106.1 hypothetical protein [Blautia producta]MCQ5123209.1 hypothetical protein [Blautia producta]
MQYQEAVQKEAWNAFLQITPRIREAENFPGGGGRSNVGRGFKYGAVSQEASAIVDGIIGIPHIEMNPIIGEFTFCGTIPVVECIRKEEDKFILFDIIIRHILGYVQCSFYHNDQDKRINISFGMYKAIFAGQVAAGDIFYRLAGIGYEI